MTHCSMYVDFDYKDAVYSGGQLVTAKLHVKILVPTRIRGITAQLKGEGEVHWERQRITTSGERGEREVTEIYRGGELYVDTSYYVVGGPGEDMTLPPGDHTYAVSLLLPQTVPASHQHHHGKVSYRVVVAIEALGQPFRYASAPITVVTWLDLNEDAYAGLRRAVHMQQEKFLCCLCCRYGPVVAALRLPVTGFVPGHSIPISLEVDNPTSRHVSSVTCVLLREDTFKVTTPSRDSLTVVSAVTRLVLGGVGAHDAVAWDEAMAIPPMTPPSFLLHCNIMDIAYSLQVEVAISGPHKKLLLQVPVVLGSIPIADRTAAPAPSAPACAVSPGLGGFPTPPPPYNSWAPPQAQGYVRVAPHGP